MLVAGKVGANARRATVETHTANASGQEIPVKTYDVVLTPTAQMDSVSANGATRAIHKSNAVHHMFFHIDEDPCRGFRCGYYAHCSDGRCECDEGYSGDPYRECQWTGGQSDDICNLPTEVGPCNEVTLRYTYNRSIGRCEAFYYSGCQGNANNFDSLEKCQQRCEALGQQDPCANVRCGHNAYCVNGYCYCNPGYEGDGNTYCRPASSGNPCEGVRCGENAECLQGQCKCMEGYYGDPFHACRPIGSGTAPSGYVEDLLLFLYDILPHPFTEMPSSNPKCQFPIDSGQCFDRLEKYGYDSRTGRCEKFLYTGCLGNENRFDTLEECERECGAAQNRCKLAFLVTALNKVPKNAVPDKCFLPLITGTCGNTHTRFGFYPPTQRCEEYNYSGCGGNENRFETRLDCETVCNALKRSEICFLPIRTGPCHNRSTRYGYFPPLKRCVRYTYGGCRGTQNNFLTEAECEQLCKGTASRGMLHLSSSPPPTKRGKCM
ncbi:Papilin [Taenia solium]|eukprot:TsM_000792000 transcript=TsM_000792000 gene=TsM_000792000